MKNLNIELTVGERGHARGRHTASVPFQCRKGHLSFASTAASSQVVADIGVLAVTAVPTSQNSLDPFESIRHTRVSADRRREGVDEASSHNCGRS